jgi:hypothetical protein
MPGFGHAEACASVGVVGAGEHGVETAPLRRQRGGNRRLYRIKAVPIVFAASDAGLVGDEHHGNSEPIAARDRRSSIGQHAHVVGAAEIVGILDHDAVAVEEERSAAGEIARPRPAPESLLDKRHGGCTGDRRLETERPGTNLVIR